MFVSNISFAHLLCIYVDLILRFIMNFCNVFNENILHLFYIFNIWQFQTHIIFPIIFMKVLFRHPWSLPWYHLFIFIIWNYPLCIVSTFSVYFVFRNFLAVICIPKVFKYHIINLWNYWFPYNFLHVPSWHYYIPFW